MYVYLRNLCDERSLSDLTDTKLTRTLTFPLEHKTEVTVHDREIILNLGTHNFVSTEKIIL